MVGRIGRRWQSYKRIRASELRCSSDGAKFWSGCFVGLGYLSSAFVGNSSPVSRLAGANNAQTTKGFRLQNKPKKNFAGGKSLTIVRALLAPASFEPCFGPALLPTIDNTSLFTMMQTVYVQSNFTLHPKFARSVTETSSKVQEPKN